MDLELAVDFSACHSGEGTGGLCHRSFPVLSFLTPVVFSFLKSDTALHSKACRDLAKALFGHGGGVRGGEEPYGM